MRVVLLICSLVLSGCAVFTAPGKATSSDAVTEAGAVYGKVIQNPSGVGCPSVVGQGAQTMGSMRASCSDNGATQTIELTAPDPNPALTTAYNGINQELAAIAALAQQLLQQAATIAAGPAGGAAAKAALPKPVILVPPPVPTS